MANETQRRSRPDADVGPPEWRGDPTEGADLIAPTAPHARPAARPPRKLSGPAKFWSLRRVRVALTIAMLISMSLHWYIAPWHLLPTNTGVELKDPADELAIPVDLLGEDTPPPPPPPPPPPEPTPPPESNDPNAPGHRDAGPPPKKPKDAGIPLDTMDAGVEHDASPNDAGEISDAGLIDDSGLVAMADGGSPGSNGPRDPAAMMGLTKTVNPGTVNVVLGVNVETIRSHPVGSRIGPVLQALPQWRDFLKSSTAIVGGTVAVEPIRDTDWILIYGPSLINTDRDAVLVHYNAADSVIDRTIASISSGYDKGGSFDAGVPGVKASLGFADNGQRVFLRPQSRLLVIVPPSHAHEAAATFKKQTPKGPPKGEAMRLIVKKPSNQISIRGLKFAESLTEIRLWIVPRNKDGGADVYGEGDCTDETAAADSADALTKVLQNINGIGVRIATRGLLNNAKVVPEGKKITLHVDASQEQLEAILQLIAAQLNVNLPPAPGSPSPNPPTRRPNE